MMYTTILLAAALQQWERYSAHALAAREVAATLAKGTSNHLQIAAFNLVGNVIQPKWCSQPRVACGHDST